mmetsp:Transcript_27091/g.74692  ORF Transcript_27091/g.74692 Transcript_27091/m.74692 type:complete len:162 (+) Transcript_27091:1366-1851(+)
MACRSSMIMINSRKEATNGLRNLCGISFWVIDVKSLSLSLCFSNQTVAAFVTIVCVVSLSKTQKKSGDLAGITTHNKSRFGFTLLMNLRPQREFVRFGYQELYSTREKQIKKNEPGNKVIALSLEYGLFGTATDCSLKDLGVGVGVGGVGVGVVVGGGGGA